MKRRNIDLAKSRRQIVNKKTKISDGIYNSVLLYLKFLLIWAAVMVADFLVEFRFEYLWPLWLLFCCALDSFRYQGMLFCLMFCGMSIASDVVCYLFIPTQWLYLAASTYVWVQFVWYTEKGLCLPTVSLWILFIYFETTLRLKDLRCAPFHLDLCRPFAAHCIGYPVVTLGFGCKSYVSYRFRMRRQREVEKENAICFELLQQALPAHLIKNTKLEEANYMEMNGEVGKNISITHLNNQLNKLPCDDGEEPALLIDFIDNNISNHSQDLIYKKPEFANQELHNKNCDLSLKNIDNVPKYQDLNNADETKKMDSKVDNRLANINDYSGDDNTSKVMKVSNLISFKKIKNNLSQDPIVRLEQEIKRGKMELWNSQKIEQELRSQITQLIASQSNISMETQQLTHDNESLQTKVSNLLTTRQQDKQALSILEKKLQEERKLKTSVEQQLQQQKKRKQDKIPVLKVGCNEACKQQKAVLESEIVKLNLEVNKLDEQIQRLEHKNKIMREIDEGSGNEALLRVLKSLRERTTILENNLSAETRLKMDLFSALGDAKRQIEIQHGMLVDRELELKDVESKVAELMALVPSSNFHINQQPHFSQTFTNHQDSRRDCQSTGDESKCTAASNLNPNATNYSPKSL